MPINMDELLLTPSAMQPPASASPGNQAAPQETNKVLNAEQDKAPEPVLCHHCGRTANNGISCEGYCVADSNY